MTFCRQCFLRRAYFPLIRMDLPVSREIRGIPGERRGRLISRSCRARGNNEETLLIPDKWSLLVGRAHPFDFLAHACDAILRGVSISPQLIEAVVAATARTSLSLSLEQHTCTAPHVPRGSHAHGRHE